MRLIKYNLDVLFSIYKNLNLRAIQPALIEVNAMSDFQVSLAPVKQGRAVVGFKMGWNMKGTTDRIEAQKERDRPSIGRKVRHKGRIEAVVTDTNGSGLIE